MATIITPPIKAVNGLLTKAIAADSQVRYLLEKQDWQTTTVTASGAPAGIGVLVTGAVEADYPTGDFVYYQSANLSYFGVFEVLSSGTGQVILDTPFKDDGGNAGYLNNRTKFPGPIYIIDVYQSDGVTKLYNKSFIYRTSLSGKSIVDMSSPLGGVLRLLNIFSLEYMLKIYEDWEGNPTPIFVADTEVTQAVLARKQVGSVGGTAMWENLLILSGEYSKNKFTRVIDSGGLIDVDSTPTAGYVVGELIRIVSYDGIYNDVGDILTIGGGTIRVNIAYTSDADGGVATTLPAKLLTKYTNPLIWKGWNRTVSNLFDEEFATREPSGLARISITDADVNKLQGVQLDATQVSASPPRIQIWGIPEGSDFYVKVDIWNGAVTSKLTETLYYENRNECPNPIMLDWINSVGGIEQHLFSIDQTVEMRADEGNLVETPIVQDYEDVRRTKRRYKSETVQRITMSVDHLTFDQLMALRELKDTESLRVYLNKDGSEFMDAVVVSSFDDTLSTNSSLHSFTIVIEFPDDFDFYTAKLY